MQEDLKVQKGFGSQWPASIQVQEVDSIDGFYSMRDWQIQAFTELKDAPHIILNAPTGGGKSWLMVLLSAYKMKQNSLLRSIITVPQTTIAAGFVDVKIQMPDGEKLHWQIKHNLCNDTVSSKPVRDCIRWLESAPKNFNDRSLICTHATIVAVYKKLRVENRLHILSNLLIFVDEAHHVRNIESESLSGAVINNALGEVVSYFLDNSTDNLQIGLTTASFFRGDRATLLTDEMEEKFTRFNLPYDQYLRSMKHLRSFRFDFLLCGHDYIPAVEKVLNTRKGKDIIYIPARNSASSTDDKYQEAEDIIRLYGNVEYVTRDGLVLAFGKHGEHKILNLVDENMRQEKKRYLAHPALKENSSSLDVIIALGMFIEGSDYRFADRAIIIGARASLVQIIQMMGRLLRDVEGKHHVEVIQLLPFSLDQQDKEQFRENLNNYLKAIYASLILENILNPIKIKSMQKNEIKVCNADERSAKNNWLRDALPDDTKQQSLIEEVSNSLIDVMEQIPATVKNVQLLREEYHKIIPKILNEYGITQHQQEIAQQVWSTLMRRTMQLQGLCVEDIDFDLVHEIHPLDFLLRYTSGVCDVTTFDRLREAIQQSRVIKRPFEQAREFARSLGLKNWNDWVRWAQNDSRPKDIPSAPDKSYAAEGFISWGDWLGTGRIAPQKMQYRCYDETQIFIQSLNLQNEHEWREWKKNNTLPSDIPNKPERVYKNKGWQGFGHLFGTGRVANQNREFLTYDEAKKIIHVIGFKTKETFIAWAKTEDCPENIPANPSGVYAEHFINWGDFLGTGKIANQNREFKSFEEAREFARSLCLNSKTEWFEWIKCKELPLDIPVAPSIKYKKIGWLGWKNWLKD